MAHTQNITAQAPPVTYTDLGSGPQTLENDTIKGTDKWYKWIADTGVVYAGITLRKNGTGYQLSKAELYGVSSGSLILLYTDTLASDTVDLMKLYAGYVSPSAEIYIHLLNVANSCTTCILVNPVVNIDIENTMLSCTPAEPCSFVKNGDFESITGDGCGISIANTDCWMAYQGSSDVFHRGCTAGGGVFNLGTNTFNFNPTVDSPNSSNTVIGMAETYESDLSAYYSESVQSLLFNPLVSGHKYQLSFWAFNYAGIAPGEPTGSENPLYRNCWVTIASSPNILSPGMFPGPANVINRFHVTSTNTWTQFTYTFTFSGASHNNILVGPDAPQNVSYGYINSSDNQNLYVFIDDVSIKEITPITINAINPSYCQNNISTATLTASGPGLSGFTWQPGSIPSPSIAVSPSVTTVYTVTGTYVNGCSVSNTYTVTVKPVPQGTITGNFSICPGGTATLTATQGSTISPGYSPILDIWTPSPCSPSCTGSVIAVSPGVTTTYTVKLSSANGCTNTATALVSILSPSNAISITGNTLYCTGQTANLSANGGTSYTWSPGGQTTASISISPTVTTTYTVNGTYACGTASAVLTVSVAPSPTLTASASPSILCAGNSSTLSAGGATSYTWNPGAYTTASAVITPTATTVYTVTGLTGSCSSTKTVQVTVNALPNVSITPVTSTICASEVISVSIAGKNVTAVFAWSTGATTSSISVSPSVTTIYSVTVTSTQTGCSVVKTATVYVVPPATVSVGSYTICAGSTATVYANGATSYTWNTGAHTSSIIVTPSVTTVYTVTGQNTGCSSTSVKTGTVTVLPALPGSLTISTSSTSPVIANGTGTNVVNLSSSITNTTGLFFEWMPNGATTPTTALSLTQPEIIQLTVYNNYCGTSISNSVCMNYVSQSCANSYTTLNNATLTNTASLADGTYFVTGTLTLNWSTPLYALEDKTFIMATGSKVEITPTSRVIFNNMKFYSCDGMWQGIELKTNGTDQAQLTISGDNNIIEDAYRAIYCINPGTDKNAIIITEEGAQFNKNYVDIYVENTNDPSRVYDIYCSKTKFLSQSSTNSPGGNLKCSGYYAPTVKSRSFAGVHGKDAGIINFNAVQYNTLYYNVIKSKDYGLYFDNTNASVNNVDFNSAVGAAYDYSLNLTPLVTGAGIYSKNSDYLNVGPATTPTTGITTIFTDMGYGIITSNTHTVDVQNTGYSNAAQSYTLGPSWGGKPEWGGPVRYAGYGINGVFITNAADVLRVNNNDFGSNYYPVTANYTVAPNSGHIMSVAQNTMSTTGVNQVHIKEGVTVNSAVSFTPTTDNMRVAANTFSNVTIGVKVTSTSSGLRVSNNTILTTTLQASPRGVYVLNSNNVTVDNNSITGGYTGSNAVNYNVLNNGVLCEKSPGCKVQCNTITQTGIGVEFRGNNSSSGDGFYNNTLQYPIKRGLFISNGGIIGTQGSSSGASNNQWTGSWPAPATGDPNKTSVGGTLTGGSASSAANSQLWVHNNSSELPDDNYITPPSSALDRYLLGTYMFTTTAGSYTTCPATLSSLRVSQSISNTEQRDADFVNYINTLLPDTSAGLSPQDKFMLKQYIFDELSNNPSSENVLQDFMSQEQNTSIDKYYEIDSLLASGNLNAAVSKNAQASQSNDITQTQNAYNTLYINGINSQADMDNLTAIANLCPQQYGTAVYQARALLQTLTFVGKVYTDSCYTQDLAGRLGYDEKKETSVSSVEGVMAKLYPNPNNGTFMLAYDLKTNNDADITITDITGKIVFVGSLDKLNNVIQINISQLQSGIYFVRLGKNKSLLWTDKLMINK